MSSTYPLDPGLFRDYCGITIKENDGKHCLASILIENRHCNLYGSAHGGFSATVLDSVCGAAAIFLSPDGKHPVTLSCNVNYLKPLWPGDAVCEAFPVKLGHTVSVYRGEIRSNNEVCVCGEFTYIYT